MTYPTDLTNRVLALHAQGVNKQVIANELGLTRPKVQRILRAATRNEALDALLGVRSDRVTDTQRDIECVARGRVETVAQALAAAQVDATQWRVAAMETRHYPIQTARGAEQGTYIKLRLVPVDGPDLATQVAALVDGALAARPAMPALHFPPAPVADGALGLVVIADPHFGKLAWRGTTNQPDWDLRIAERTVRESVAWLVQRLPPVERIVLALLGDVFHYDTLHGTTTGGTTMDRDSRIAKVLAIGSETITRAVWTCAAKAPTDVLAVPGNHDAVMTLALQRILCAEFRQTARVCVDEGYTRRKPYLWGKTLLQFDHGDKAKKKLAHLLPQEHPERWGQSVYREIHTGHLHTDGEVASTLTEQGVIVRTHPALCPSDQWHFDEGYTGSPRGAQAFVYRAAGGLEQILRFDPRLHLAQEAA
jgi:hypothetical protein